MGVVALPSRVTGLRAISIIEEITFIPGCQASSNSSHLGLSLGDGWRRILKRTDLESAMVRIFGLCRLSLVTFPRLRRNHQFKKISPKTQRRFARNEKADCRILPAHQYFLALGGIKLTSTGSNSNFGSSASGAK